MAGEAEPLAPSTTGAGAMPEPAAASPAPAPAATPEPAAAAAPVAPAAEPAAPAPAAEPAAPAAPASEPTLLEKFDAEQAEKAKTAAKPDPKSEAKPDTSAVEAKPKDGAAAPEPGKEGAPEPVALEPVAYEYTLPETIKLDDAAKTEFHGALDAFRKDPVKGAQSLIDMHNKAMTEFAEQVYRDQVATFNQTRKGWQDQVKGDEELGGAGYQTSMGAIARMRDMLVGEKHLSEFNDFLKVTGAGDHPAFLRMLHNAARIFDEAPMPPPGAKPPANIGNPQRRGLRGIYKSNQGRQ